jgi:hypoxia up-regulated 1
MGAGSTTATIVSFTSHSVKDGKTNKSVIDIATHGIGYDRELGGDLFNARIVDNFVDAFRASKAGAKANTDIKTDGRAFARLFKEAARVKQVLSANIDTTATVILSQELTDVRLNHYMKILIFVQRFHARHSKKSLLILWIELLVLFKSP